jgi:DNA mismatch repair ATPase MutS
VKPLLMHRQTDFDYGAELPEGVDDLVADLELETLFEAMAGQDSFLFELARRAVLQGLRDAGEIRYRQEVLADAIAAPGLARALYDLAGEAIEAERKVWRFIFQDRPSSLVPRSVDVMDRFVGFLRRLRELAEEHAPGVHSEGFTRFFDTVRAELDEAYLSTVEAHLKELKFRHGKLFSAELGPTNKGSGYVLRRPRERGLRERLPFGGFSRLSFTIPDRDENGFRALSELEDRGLKDAAVAIAQATDHVLSYFIALRTEAGFYLACLNLRERLQAKGQDSCFPEPLSCEEQVLAAVGLYDPCLALKLRERVVPSDLTAEGKTLVMITGANQGGKSTFLRAIGLAQLMMQAGMFTPARSLRANVCAEVFTHYKREEDEAMEGGKLDEELARMSQIAERIRPSCLLLCNESFASTNEREGSEIARQVIRAMTDNGIKVVFVTHLFELADSLSRQQLDTALFLRAERRDDGARTFRLLEGDPLPTSHGRDSFEAIFGPSARVSERADGAQSAQTSQRVGG